MALRYLTLRASKKLKDHRFNWIVHHIQEIYLHLFPKDIEINNSTKIAIIFGPIGDEPVWNSVLGVTSYYIENFDFDNFYRLNKIEQENLILEIVNNTIVNISERNGKNKDAKQKIIATKNKIKDIKFSMEIDIKKLSKTSLDKKYKINIYRILNKESGEGWKYIKLNRKTKEIIEEHWINEIPDHRDLTDYYKKAEITSDGYILYNNLGIMVYKVTERECLQYNIKGEIVKCIKK
jgi:hypothetical protein